MMGDARSVAFAAMACSGVTILACLFIVPLIHSQLDQWTTRVQLQMKLFKTRTDDSWNQMMILRRDLRTKRQAGLELDFLDQLDEDIFAEFGEDFGNDDFLDPIPPSPRSREDRPRFARPEPAFDPRPPAFGDVRRAPATRRQLRPREELVGRGPDGRRRIASPQETQDSLISEGAQSEISGVTQPQGSVESGYTASPKGDAEPSPRGAYDSAPSASSYDPPAPARQQLSAYERPADPAPRRRPAAREDSYSRPAAREDSYSRPAAREDSYSRPAAREPEDSYSRPAAREPEVSYARPAPRQDSRRQPAPRRSSYNQPPQTPRYNAKPKSQCNCKKLSCPAGPPGDSGIPGRDGRQGLAGSGGLAGLAGPDLEPIRIEPPCSTCPQGPQGQSGNAGKPGLVGPKGWSGQHGAHGRDGSQGSMGGKGPIGSAGRKGKAGYQGLNGLDLLGGKGQPGKKGTSGTTGPPGTYGKSGKSFYHPGSPGARGAEGKKGPSGVNGIPGLPGPIGDRGELGVDALYCPCPERDMRPFYQTPEGEVDQQSYDNYRRRQ